MTEAQLMESIRDLLRYHRLLAFHATDSRRCWGPGLPDLVIVGGSGVIYREVKTERGQLDAEQSIWRWRLQAAGADWGLWRPADLQSGRVDNELRAVR